MLKFKFLKSDEIEKSGYKKVAKNVPKVSRNCKYPWYELAVGDAIWFETDKPHVSAKLPNTLYEKGWRMSQTKAIHAKSKKVGFIVTRIK